MKQLLQNIRSGETTVTEVPIPTPKAGEALVRTEASLVSAGTERMVVEFAEKSLIGKARTRPDLVQQVVDKARREGVLTTIDATFNRLDQPMPLGYSSAGTIQALGEGMGDFHVGQRVACAGGGYAVHAEFAIVPKNLLVPIPDEVNFESAAFTTLGAIALHGFRLARPQLGERVGIIGLGLLGLLTVGIARAAGCFVFGVDLDPQRVKLAKEFGAEAVTRDQAEQAALSFSLGKGCDSVLICADTPASDPVELAGIIARDRASIVAVGAVGLELPRKTYFEKELKFINSRSYGPGRYDPLYEENGQDYPIGYVRWTEGRNLSAFVDLLSSGKVNVNALITHRYSIDQAPKAYELITGKIEEPFLGVLLTYPKTTQDPELATKTRETISPQPSKHEVQPVQSEINRVNLGVLGAGNFSTAVMLPILRKIPSVDLVGIASASGMNAQHAANRYKFQYADSDDTKIINDPTINTIAVFTRHNLHVHQVLAGLEAGKHVFCEKPLALNQEELDEIKGALDTIPTSSTKTRYPMLMVGFNRRFAPLSQRLKDFLVDSNDPMVAHYRVNAGFIPLNHWLHNPEQGGGRIIGEACHFIDYLTFLVGVTPSEVSAQALPDAGRYKQDNVVITLNFPDGSIGIMSYLANGDKAVPKERVEVFCGGRVAVLDDFRSLTMVSNGKRRVERSRFRQDKGHYGEWQAFTQSILTGGTPPIPYDHIFGVTRTTFATMEALRSGARIKVG